MADTVDDQVNAGSTDANGDLIIEESSGPTTLATIELNDPAFGAASSGSMTLDGLPKSDTSADNTGTADRFTVRDKNNAKVFDGSVTGTGGGGDMELDNTSINSGQTVEITSFDYTAPN